MLLVEIATAFGMKLSLCRKRAGLSQEELAVRASLHRTEIGLLERGERLPRIDTVIKLAGALAISPGDLIEGIDWSPGSTSRGSFSLGPSDE
jgi:XRE family transcriptional regulator, regulator of sulfur utilization